MIEPLVHRPTRYELTKVSESVRAVALAIRDGETGQDELAKLLDVLTRMRSPHTRAITTLICRGRIVRQPTQRYLIHVPEEDNRPELIAAHECLETAIRLYCSLWRRWQSGLIPAPAIGVGDYPESL